MSEVGLYLAQRISAMVMVPLVAGHIAVMVHAVEGGLSAGEILGRTQGSVFWFAFYGLFVLAVSVHGSIGLRAILREWAGLRGAALSAASIGAGLVLLALGTRAVWAVTFAELAP